MNDNQRSVVYWFVPGYATVDRSLVQTQVLAQLNAGLSKGGGRT